METRYDVSLASCLLVTSLAGNPEVGGTQKALPWHVKHDAACVEARAMADCRVLNTSWQGVHQRNRVPGSGWLPPIMLGPTEWAAPAGQLEGPPQPQPTECCRSCWESS
jgi:hypothetical protein